MKKGGGDDTRNMIIVGVALAGIGYFWNKFKSNESTLPVVSTSPAPSTSIQSLVSNLLPSTTKPTIAGNTGLASVASQLINTTAALLTKSSAPATTQPAINSNQPATIGQLTSVVSQVNDIIGNIINPPPPPTPASTVNSDANTKFLSALQWAKTATTHDPPKTSQPAKYVWISTGGQLWKYDLKGNSIMNEPDQFNNRNSVISLGYSIF